MKRSAMFNGFIGETVHFLRGDYASVNASENRASTLRSKIKRQISFGHIRHTRKHFVNCGRRALW